MIAIFTGSCSSTMVAISWNVIWKPPSPQIVHTARSGQATAAPMAAGTSKPIVPRPPEVISWCGRAMLPNCAAHIWCWPTPVVRTASGPMNCAIFEITCCCVISSPGGTLIDSR